MPVALNNFQMAGDIDGHVIWSVQLGTLGSSRSEWQRCKDSHADTLDRSLTNTSLDQPLYCAAAAESTKRYRHYSAQPPSARLKACPKKACMAV